MNNLKYPVGHYEEQPFSEKQLKDWLLQIKHLPLLLEHAITNLDEAQLETPYRPDGWTVKELVHHVADSHINAYMRFKLGLTEDNPTIRPYDQEKWAALPDTKNLPVNISTTLLHALHRRLFEILSNMEEADWRKTIFHPEQKKKISLWYLLGMYAWHGRHHVAHITALRERNGW